jgi:hypothetical protein
MGWCFWKNDEGTPREAPDCAGIAVFSLQKWQWPESDPLPPARRSNGKPNKKLVFR